MPKYRGNLLIVSKEDSPGAATYTTLASVRSKDISFNNERIDVTTDDDVSGGVNYRVYLAGLQEVTVSVSGLEDTGVEALRADAAAQTVAEYQISFPNGDTLVGDFWPQNLTAAGEFEDAVTWSVTLVSNAAPTFTAA